MSIQVPSPSYGPVAAGDARPSEPDPADPSAPAPDGEPREGPIAGLSDRVVDRSDDPRRPSADPTTSGEPMHAASPTRQSSAHARATIDLMQHPPCGAGPGQQRTSGPVPRFGFDREPVATGRARFGSRRVAARPLGWAL